MADRTLDLGVSHSPAAARKRTEAARPCLAADREAGHSREAARKHTVVARPPVVDRSLVADRRREAERTAVAYNRVPPRTRRVRVATCKRRAAADSRAVADRTAEMRRNRVAVYKTAAAAHNHAVVQKHTDHNPVLAADRSREATRAAPGSARKRDPQPRLRRGALPRWQSQCKSAASVLSSVAPANLNTEVGPGVPPTESTGQSGQSVATTADAALGAAAIEPRPCGAARVTQGYNCFFGPAYLAGPKAHPPSRLSNTGVAVLGLVWTAGRRGSDCGLRIDEPAPIVGICFVRSAMIWLRTIRPFVRLLVALFMVAQFAGVVSSPRANAQADALASLSHEHAHHGSMGQTHEHHHRDHGGNPADACCALHAYFVGVISPVIGVLTDWTAGETLVAGLVDKEPGLPPGRLDRPPRPLR